MPNPFSRLARNATDTTRRDPDRRDATELKARTCPQCGAPRPERTDLRTCDYCGFTFMTRPAAEVRPDA